MLSDLPGAPDRESSAVTVSAVLQMPHWQRRSVIAYKYENSSNLIQVEAGLKGLSESSRMEPGFQIPDAIRNGQTFRTRPGAGDLIQVCILLLAEDALRTQAVIRFIGIHLCTYSAWLLRRVLFSTRSHEQHSLIVPHKLKSIK